MEMWNRGMFGEKDNSLDSSVIPKKQQFVENGQSHRHTLVCKVSVSTRLQEPFVNNM